MTTSTTKAFGETKRHAQSNVFLDGSGFGGDGNRRTILAEVPAMTRLAVASLATLLTLLAPPSVRGRF
jgi:hypothetical protein